jgi:ABC-type glycerol-3-phosphate transport system permease component
MLRAVAVPLAKPILTTLIVLQANGVWNEYIWPIMVLSRPERYPAMLAVLNFRNLQMGGYDPGAEFAAYVIAGLPLLLLFAFSSRAFIRGLTSGALKF